MTNAAISLRHNPERRDLEYVLQILPATYCNPLEVAVKSHDEVRKIIIIQYFFCMDNLNH